MTRIFVFAVLTVIIALPGFTFAQDKGTKAYCWAAKGVNIREKASGKAALLGKITYKSEITVIDTLFDSPYTDTLNKSIAVKGWWLKIKQGSTTGYAFSGYLSLIPTQTFYQFFNNLPEVIADTSIIIEGTPRLYKTHTFKRADGSFYSYIIGDGCWNHMYFIKGGTLNDGLMLISTTEPHEAESCELVFKMSSGGNVYQFPDCNASQDRTLQVKSEGIVYTSYDCD